MSRNKLIKLLLAGLFLVVTIVLIILGDESIFPSSLVAFFLVLTRLGDSRANLSSIEKASQRAVITFSIIVILLNIFVPIILPAIVTGSDIPILELTTDMGTQDPQEHFIEVTINDMRELCFSTSVLLVINLLFLFVFRKRG